MLCTYFLYIDPFLRRLIMSYLSFILDLHDPKLKSADSVDIQCY